MRGSPYAVIVCDLFNRHEPDHEVAVLGFPSRELAVEYARRRTWSSVEQMREPGLSREEVRRRWQALGEDCRVVGPEGVIYVASAELDRFLEHPIPPERRDWAGLYRSLLPDDFALTYEWAAGSVPPPHHDEYTIVVEPPDRGHLLFWPDYPSERVEPWTADFYPDLTARILLHNWAQATGLFDRAQAPPAAPGIGGETGRLDVVAAGRRARLAVHLLPEEERTALHRLIRSLVPGLIWAEMETRRRRYIETTYPDEGA